LDLSVGSAIVCQSQKPRWKGDCFAIATTHVYAVYVTDSILLGDAQGQVDLFPAHDPSGDKGVIQGGYDEVEAL
jgi:hypothetical protein